MESCMQAMETCVKYMEASMEAVETCMKVLVEASNQTCTGSFRRNVR